VPDWLLELENRQLLLKSRDPHADFHFSQKLCSYALAFWACETAYSAASDLAASLKTDSIPSAVSDNFSFYQSFVAPSDLEEFDKRFGLTVNR